MHAMGELALRFVAGAVVVTAFAVLGDVLKPKSFAGIFGAAPSVALATLTLTFLSDGASIAAIEGRSMIVGAVAFTAYSLVLAAWLAHRSMGAAPKAVLAWGTWLVVALGLWWTVLR
jgi:hypothetical protein